MSVAIELQAERTPSRHAHIDQAQLGVDEVEVIVQAFTGSRAQESAMGLFAMPGLVGGTRFHRRDDMHQAGMVAACGQQPRAASTSATTSSLRMWLLAMCSMVMPAAAANSAARSRTRSRSGSANRG